MACIRVSEGAGEYCIVQFFHQMELNGEPILDDRDCPIVLLSDTLMCVRSHRILGPVSLVHECNNKCVLQKSRKRTHIEREQHEMTSLSVIHDYKRNNMFAVNIYCMKNVYS